MGKIKSGIVRSSATLKAKQVHQDIEATVGEDILSNSMVKKWAGRFERGRESLEDHPIQKDCTMPDFVNFFSFSRSRRLETANWLCLIISSRKTRNGYIGLNLQYMHQLNRSAHALNYNCKGIDFYLRPRTY